MVVVADPRLHADIARWVDQRIPGDHIHGFSDKATAIGFIENGKPMGGVVYHSYSKWNIVAAIALEKGYALPRRAVRAIFEYPFVQLPCLRMTAIIASKNQKSIEFCQRLGFSYEGTLENATPTDSHLIFGLLKRNCRWLATTSAPRLATNDHRRAAPPFLCTTRNSTVH